MDNHYVLYYLLLEDKNKYMLSEEKAAEIRKNIQSFYRKIKPPWNGNPLEGNGEEIHSQ